MEKKEFYLRLLDIPLRLFELRKLLNEAFINLTE